jgi:hypothetical protein
MPERIASFLATKPPAECARLIADARQYITNDSLVKLIQGFDTHNHKKNMKFKNQLLLFSDIPGLKEEVDEWMNSI